VLVSVSVSQFQFQFGRDSISVVMTLASVTGYCELHFPLLLKLKGPCICLSAETEASDAEVPTRASIRIRESECGPY